jgi:hypothetical protein
MTDTILTLLFMQTQEKPGSTFHHALGEAIEILRTNRQAQEREDHILDCYALIKEKDAEIARLRG